MCIGNAFASFQTNIRYQVTKTQQRWSKPLSLRFSFRKINDEESQIKYIKSEVVKENSEWENDGKNGKWEFERERAKEG